MSDHEMTKNSFEPKYVRLSEAEKTFGFSENSLIEAGIEGQLRVYFLLGEERLAVRLRVNPDGTFTKLGEEPQRKHFTYIPVCRHDLESVLRGEVGTDVPAFTRPDKDGVYWARVFYETEALRDGLTSVDISISRERLFFWRSELRDRRVAPPEDSE